YEDIPYSEMFTEGKEWTLCHYGAINDYYNPGWIYTQHALIYVTVDGEAFVEGINCKKLKIDVKLLSHPYCWECEYWLDREFSYFGGLTKSTPIAEEVYVYEKDRRIYFYRNPGLTLENYEVKKCEPYFQLYMDLNKSVGEYAEGLGKIISDEIIEINGNPHRRIVSSFSDDERWPDMEWIEGVGGSMGLGLLENDDLRCWYFEIPTDMAMRQSYYMLVQVRDNGKIIYDNNDKLKAFGFDVITNVEENLSEKIENNVCYDLMGRPLKNPQKGELYIKNGKKYIQPL
ncbi:MAG: hypothetical protein K2I91_06350, partial [Muribaculaceae bacterium]|nr:hypothetical protein [Muribaculaceae bacterium]